MRDEEELKHWAMVFWTGRGLYWLSAPRGVLTLDTPYCIKFWVVDASSQKIPSEGGME